MREAAFGALGFFAGAATFFFVFIIVLLFFTAPAPLLPILLTQKILYAAVMVGLIAKLRSGALTPIHLNGIITLVVTLCLSSSLITALCGLPGRSGSYSVILILGCALVEISYRWAAFHWALVWFSWAATVTLANAPILNDFVELIGVQLIAVAAVGLRLRLYKAQFVILQRLEGALEESERVRSTLDYEVGRRTEQLTAANEELTLSMQERERIAQEGEKLREQLMQSQKMESLGRLAGGVAHDFNNLLTVISGSLELARLEPVSPDVDDLLAESVEAATRAGDLTSQLLAFSRKQVMKVKPFVIQTTLESSIKLIERLLGEDIRLEVSLSCPDAVVDGDPSQIQQAFMNLVVNARDAMPEGGTLKIGLVRKEAQVELTVADTGHGIPLEIQDRVFEPFFTSKPMGSGTGLGLATVHGIVSKHNGVITIDSVPGYGSRFVVTLPLATSGVSSRPEPSGHRPEPAVPGCGRVLLVEDNAQVRTLAAHSLRISGYQVKVFEDGETALASLDQNVGYDVLVTDVIMPGMDGGRLAEAVLLRLPNLPVLFMSGYTDDRLSSSGILCKEDCGFLAKPFGPIALQKAVADVLTQRSKLTT